MRHGKKINHLGRKSAHRQAMLSNMAASLILHKRIKTTLQKAKTLRMYIEPLINRSKDNTTHSRRIVFSYLQNKEAVTELFRNISDKVANRPGGYTRILKIENRLGDNAEMCYIELVDYNENMLKTDDKKTTTRRSRRGSGKSSHTTQITTPAKTEKKEEQEISAVESSSEKTVETLVANTQEVDILETEIVGASQKEIVETSIVEISEVVETPITEIVETSAVEVNSSAEEITQTEDTNISSEEV